jgi:YD repeat-containing protein
LSYDSAGRLNALVISRGTISFGYDATKGLIASINAPDGVNLAYTYDGSLQKSGTASGPVPGAIARTYDNNFRVTSLAVNGGPHVL